MSASIPEGFAPHFRKSPVTDPWEPLYSRATPEAVQIGLVIAQAHCNARGMLHGGVIAALADNAMGLSYGAALGGDVAGGLVTVSLSVDYLGAAELGDWLEVCPAVIRAGGAMGFVEARVLAGGAAIARASAVFRRLSPGAPG